MITLLSERRKNMHTFINICKNIYVFNEKELVSRLDFICVPISVTKDIESFTSK